MVKKDTKPYEKHDNDDDDDELFLWYGWPTKDL